MSQLTNGILFKLTGSEFFKLRLLTNVRPNPKLKSKTNFSFRATNLYPTIKPAPMFHKGD